MRKVVRKLRPIRCFCLGEHESWFTDMAAKGLRLKRIGWYFAQFVPGEPEEMRYRVDVFYNRSMTKDIIQMYKKNGWDYVTRDGHFAVFSSPVHRNAPELHTDPGEQSYTIKAMDTKFAMYAVFIFLCIISMVLFSSDNVLWVGMPIIELVDTNWMINIMSSSVWLVLIGESLWAAISIRKIRINLIDGKPIDHNAPWKKYRRVFVTILTIYIIVFGYSYVSFIFSIFNFETKPLPQDSTQLPIVRLADIEQNPKLILAGTDDKEDCDELVSSYSFVHSAFAPVQYESNESGMIPKEGKKKSPNSYLPSIYTKVYKLTFPSMAKKLALELQEREGDISAEENLVMIKNTTLDYAVVFQKESTIEVFAVEGNGVIFVSYSGLSDVNTTIKEMEKKMNLITK